MVYKKKKNNNNNNNQVLWFLLLSNNEYKWLKKILLNSLGRRVSKSVHP
jgi:hypothetical protein